MRTFCAAVSALKGGRGGLVSMMGDRNGQRREAMKTLGCAIILFFSSLVCAQSADLILINGKIVTADENNTVAQAIAIQNGRILAMGANGEVRALGGPNSRIVDLGGRTVIPGLIDSHIHAIRAALSYAT